MAFSDKSLFSLFPLFALLCLLPILAHAQSAEKPAVTEDELRTCLKLDQEGNRRFNILEQRASTLRTTGRQLAERRTELQAQQARLQQNKADSDATARFNEAIKDFNSRTDRLNSEVSQFETDSQTYQTWLNSTLKPACDRLANRPVSDLTAFYACGFDKQGEFAQHAHCKTLPNADSLKACVQKAGSKPRALEACNEL